MVSKPEKIRLIAIDLDGTLLNNAGLLSAENILAIQEALAHNLQIIPASARPPFGMDTISTKLGLNGHMIAYNGGLVLTSSLDQVLRDCPMSHEDTQVALDIIRRHDLYTGYYVGMEWYVEKKCDEMTWEGRALQREAIVVNLSTDAPPQPHKLIVADLKDRPRLEHGYKDMRENLPHLNIHYSGNASFEVSDGLASKGSALAFLADQLKIPPEGIMCIGNNENDLDMLRFAGLAVVVNNAEASIRSTADWLVSSNERHGVAEAIFRLISSERPH